MQVTSKLIKSLWISLTVLILSFCIVDAVYARGGCFGEGTLILTPAGYTPVEQLHPGDPILSYNFTTQQLEEGHIGDVRVVDSPDYFLINGKTKVTGTHPFYVQNG